MPVAGVRRAPWQLSGHQQIDALAFAAQIPIGQHSKQGALGEEDTPDRGAPDLCSRRVCERGFGISLSHKFPERKNILAASSLQVTPCSPRFLARQRLPYWITRTKREVHPASREIVHAMFGRTESVGPDGDPAPRGPKSLEPAVDSAANLARYILRLANLPTYPLDRLNV
jgi:hypothetical protein